MEWRPGTRVYSTLRGYYYGVPGILEGKSQVQTFDRPGWSYNVRLDNGRTIRLSDIDIAEVTPEIEEAYERQAEEAERVNARAKARLQREADAIRGYNERVKNNRRQAAEERREKHEAEHEAEQTKLREEKGREYGLRSLGIKNE